MFAKFYEKIIRARSELREIHEALPAIKDRLDHLDPPQEQEIEYIKSYPSSANQVDLYKDLWISQIPIDGLASGGARLFEDQRVTRTAEALGGLEGKRILELGPLEGFHSYMFEDLGAESVLAIESNALAFQKCLVVKNLLDMKTKFLLGDFNAYFDQSDEHFDLTFASGVLYHMVDPALTIKRICQSADAVFLWTHYYDETVIRNGEFTHLFPEDGVQDYSIDGITVKYHARLYQEALDWKGFCGGGEGHANWIERKDLEALLDHYGFEIVNVSDDIMDHPHGPAVCFVAKRKSDG